MMPDATAVVTAVRAVLTAQQAWQGTATELLRASLLRMPPSHCRATPG